MKKIHKFVTTILLSAFVALFVLACNQAPKTETTDAFFGKKIDDLGAISIAEVEKKMVNGAKTAAKVKAKINAACQSKGCWMDLEKDDKSVMRVTFKDYEFFVPKDCAGKTAIAEGFAYYDTTTVEMLKHYAEDAGKPAEEVAAIDKPKVELVFEADGVIIR